MKNCSKFLFCLPVLLGMPLVTQAQELPVAGTRLDINAQAQVKANPDVATMTASVVTTGATAQAARADNATKMQAAFKILKDKKMADKDVQTSNLTITPDYIYAEKQAPKIAGYQAVNTLTVTLHDLNQASDIVDSLIGNGINQLNGPTFGINDPDQLLNIARLEAIKKARARAELYAQATGLTIKRIVSISENANVGAPMPMMMMKSARGTEMADAMTPVAQGQINLDVTVNVTYELN